MNGDAPCVLVYGHDSILLETRAMVIRTAGFCTCTAKSPSELSKRVKLARCKALLLCHTLSNQEADQASRLAKQEILGIKVIAMAKFLPAVDESLGSFVRPEELLSALERVLPPAPSYQ